MVIKTKFRLGDKVYSIKRDSFFKRIKCDRCDGEGSIEFTKHVIVTCPTCKGWGFDGRWDKGNWKASSDYDVIWTIRGQTGYLGNKVSYTLADESMGCTTEWKETDLFHTLEDAEDECYRRNNE